MFDIFSQRKRIEAKEKKMHKTIQDIKEEMLSGKIDFQKTLD